MSTRSAVDHALAYPEPPPSLLWRHPSTTSRPLTDAQRRRNRELLLLDLARNHPHHPATTNRKAS
ncbi:hypothetical protein ACFY9C_35045 [Streptomyces filamentosus]|uniref:hypothetical protein n=1 Tax=Streptomyces filamentosus TaxID=67294 RepID=UPI0036EF2811